MSGESAASVVRDVGWNKQSGRVVLMNEDTIGTCRMEQLTGDMKSASLRCGMRNTVLVLRFLSNATILAWNERVSKPQYAGVFFFEGDLIFLRKPPEGGVCIDPTRGCFSCEVDGNDSCLLTVVQLKADEHTPGP